MDTLDKIYKELGKLYDADSNLIDILEHAGRDYETKYTEAYLAMLEDVKALRNSLHALLDNYADAIVDIEHALEPLPMKPQKNTTANHMVAEAIGAAKRTGKALYE